MIRRKHFYKCRVWVSDNKYLFNGSSFKCHYFLTQNLVVQLRNESEVFLIDNGFFCRYYSFFMDCYIFSPLLDDVFQTFLGVL